MLLRPETPLRGKGGVSVAPAGKLLLSIVRRAAGSASNALTVKDRGAPTVVRNCPGGLISQLGVGFVPGMMRSRKSTGAELRTFPLVSKSSRMICAVQKLEVSSPR